jgi:hypothetical protein
MPILRIIPMYSARAVKSLRDIPMSPCCNTGGPTSLLRHLVSNAGTLRVVPIDRPRPDPWRASSGQLTMAASRKASGFSDRATLRETVAASAGRPELAASRRASGNSDTTAVRVRPGERHSGWDAWSLRDASGRPNVSASSPRLGASPCSS